MIFYSKSTDICVNHFLKITFTVTARLVFDTTLGHRSLVKLTHIITGSILRQVGGHDSELFVEADTNILETSS